jgi:hypothetical protein
MLMPRHCGAGPTIVLMPGPRLLERSDLVAIGGIADMARAPEIGRF